MPSNKNVDEDVILAKYKGIKKKIECQRNISSFLIFFPFFCLGGEQSKDGKEAVEALASVYSHWIKEERIIKTNTWSSELSKLVKYLLYLFLLYRMMYCDV